MVILIPCWPICIFLIPSDRVSELLTTSHSPLHTVDQISFAWASVSFQWPYEQFETAFNVNGRRKPFHSTTLHLSSLSTLLGF